MQRRRSFLEAAVTGDNEPEQPTIVMQFAGQLITNNKPRLLTLPEHEAVFCPHCGKFVDELDDDGWCMACTASTISGMLCIECKHCHSPFYRRHLHKFGAVSPTCSQCKYRISKGLAITDYKDVKKPDCAICGIRLTRTERMRGKNMCEEHWRLGIDEYKRLRGRGKTYDETITILRQMIC